MKLIIIVMIVRLIIKVADKKSAKEKIIEKRNDVRDPAAFQLR